MPVGGGGGSRVRGRESRGRRGGRGRVRAVRGSCVASSGASRESGEAGGGQQGGRWRARVPASVGHTPFPCQGGRRQRRGGQAGWAASWLGRPAAAGLRRGGEAQVSPSFFYFCFLIFSDICFDLINILNHLIFLCQFLQELDILFQSSFIIGIIFGPYFIYIEIYFQCKYLSN